MDTMLYVAGSQQSLHFQQLKHALSISGERDLAEKCEHVGFGMVNGMSTRKGTVVFLQDIIDKVICCKSDETNLCA
eukprot:m.238069 g.238069  ORF g.238069 m.238069 type:complete len:76 (+) comp15283_c1_seq11:115-342(+)